MEAIRLGAFVISAPRLYSGIALLVMIVAAEVAMMAMGFAWLAGIIGASASWQFGVAPFILPDLIKVALAAAIVPAVWALFARR